MALYNMSPNQSLQRVSLLRTAVVFLSAVECFVVLIFNGVRNLWKILISSCFIFLRESTRCMFPDQYESILQGGTALYKRSQRHVGVATEAACAALKLIRRTLPIDIIRDDCFRGWHMILQPTVLFSFRLTRDVTVRALAVGLFVLGSFFPFLGRLLWPTTGSVASSSCNITELLQYEISGSIIEMNEDSSFISDLSNDGALLSTIHSPKTPTRGASAPPSSIDAMTIISSSCSPLSTVSEEDTYTPLHTRPTSSSGSLEDCDLPKLAVSKNQFLPSQQMLLTDDEDTEEDTSSSIPIPVKPFPSTFQHHPIEAIRSKWNHYAELEERGVRVAPRYRTKLRLQHHRTTSE